MQVFGSADRNARDAMMPNGGVLKIATAILSIDPAAAENLQLPVGEFVSLSVRDTGSGMDEEIIERIFDPFFTTKPMAHGTGLGLSMVYGFVHQSKTRSGMNGRQVANAMRAARVGLKVLFITGYAETAAVREGLVERGTSVMVKPLDLTVLLHRVREMLGS